ncbi:cupin domain-containing protein [Mycobacterium sp. 1274761.0]|uniref:cupin domain-containing protein n=1 Tax=Mycobacterium sp. 1274761.0 TaxID=1834077 RepID=UPI0007FF11B7|nr:cupin domain-containing protein [Mycobacterium sp. 1274761.0]OBK74520.1 cupin [Mycobacterium sp. 1274761.0]
MKTVAWFALAAAAITAMSPAAAGTASATAPRDTDGTVLWQMSDDGKDYIFREITIAPGGSTGWHSHDGQLFAVVKEGVLTHNRADCSVDGVYVAGQSLAEKGGPDYVHIGRNLGPEPLVLQVLYVDPSGAPLSDDAPDPGCGFD